MEDFEISDAHSARIREHFSRAPDKTRGKCVCGGNVSSSGFDPESVRIAVASHQRTSRHWAWRRGQIACMQKIISLFQRNYDGDRLVRDEVVPGAEWVIAGEGVATRKWDGTAVLVRDGRLFARYDAKRGKTPPAGWEAAQEPDPVTGHWPGWIEATRPEDRSRSNLSRIQWPHE